MTRKRNTRMQHRPKGTGLSCIRDSKPPTAKEVLHVMNRIRIAYQRLREGNGDYDDYLTMELMSNLGIVRGEAIDPRIEAIFRKSGEAVIECAQLHQRHGKFGFTGMGILSLNAAVDAYAEIVANTSLNDMATALNEVTRRLEAGQVVHA